MQASPSGKEQLPFSRKPLATAVIMALASPAVVAQENLTVSEITVTAQKRDESLQEIPFGLQVLEGQAIRDLGIANFKDYAQLLSSVSVTPSLGAGSSLSKVYMRGIATANDGDPMTVQPSVAMYLDETAITTIQGNLDVHMYDIARVEASAGPQGTLFGANAQSGAIRVITNKPELGEVSGEFGLESNFVDSDDTGYTAEGFVNLPIGENAAIRLVGWSRSDAGWVDNVAGNRTFPGVASTSADDIVIANAPFAEENYNTIDTLGARASLRIDLDENWTVTPSLMYQNAEGEGSWGDDLSTFTQGDNAVTHFKEEFTDDEWSMIGLTIEGRVGNFDLVYAGSYLDRTVDGSYDYADYSYWYDTIYTTGYYADLHFSNTGVRALPNQFFPTAGTRIMPGARFTNDDNYTKQSHELRLSTDPEKSVRGTIGYFWQHQYHDFEQRYLIEGLGDLALLNQGNDARFQDTIFLNSLDRDDRDRALFGHVSFDLSEDVELTVGARFFEPEVTVSGFSGFGLGLSPIWSPNGENQCNSFPNGQQDFEDKPCLNVDKGIEESESVARVNLSWQVADDRMIYATWSEGYRPGGINVAPSASDYVSDTLTNIELGWKTQWMHDSLRFNGAIFHEEWDDIQLFFVATNGVRQVSNGPSAEVDGLEAQMIWLPTDGLSLSASVSFFDSELSSVYADFDSGGAVTAVRAAVGSALPITADFKGNLIARYEFPMGLFDAHVQGVLVHEGKRGSDLNQVNNAIRGDVPAYTTVDLNVGMKNESYGVELYVKNLTDEDAPLYLSSQCITTTCGAQNYGVRVRPTTLGLKFTKEF